jgi:hypothetical protein
MIAVLYETVASERRNAMSLVDQVPRDVEIRIYSVGMYNGVRPLF